MTIKKIFSFKKVQNYWKRQGFVKYIFLFVFFGFAYQVTNILNSTSSDGRSVKDRGVDQAYFAINKNAIRGDILDRHGNILASNLILKKVNLDPMIIQDEYIPLLAKSLEMDTDKLTKIINKKRKIGSKYLIIKKNLAVNSKIVKNINKLKTKRISICKDIEVENKLPLIDKALDKLGIQTAEKTYKKINTCKRKKIAGVVLEEDSKRYYPKSASLAPLIGKVNHQKKGAYGIEYEFDNILAGQSVKQTLNYDDKTSGSDINTNSTGDHKHGEDIHLTIDSDLQFHTFSALKKSVEKHDADAGSAVILSANGEILALANYPADNPNDNSTYKPSHWKNRALQDKVEPGSTMKPFTMLLALDRKQINAEDDEFIDVSKSIGHIKTNKEVRKYGDAITVKKILQKSHNLGTVNVSERLSKEDMFETWNKLGFGHPLGLMPSIETPGTLRHHSSWAASDKRTLSFGHGPMQTNLTQLAKAYLVFANDGATLPVKLIKNSNTYGEKVQVFDKEATKKISELLDSVASDDGSGYRAQIKGYDVAGKTGTAEMVVDGKYHKKGAKRTFFAGYVPANKPKYIMAISLDYPKNCYTYWNPDVKNKCEGSNSAAMVFRDTMQGILSNDKSLKIIASK